jgi:hypothetical protein
MTIKQGDSGWVWAIFDGLDSEGYPRYSVRHGEMILDGVSQWTGQLLEEALGRGWTVDIRPFPHGGVRASVSDLRGHRSEAWWSEEVVADTAANAFLGAMAKAVNR